MNILKKLACINNGWHNERAVLTFLHKKRGNILNEFIFHVIHLMMFYSPRSFHKKAYNVYICIYFGRRSIFSFSNIKDNWWTLLNLDFDVRFVFLLNRLIYTVMHASFHFVCGVFLIVFRCSHPLVELWLCLKRQGNNKN